MPKPRNRERSVQQGAHTGLVAGAFVEPPGFRPPPSGTIATYRMMRNNPTIAIARLAACMAVKAADWVVDIDDEFEQSDTAKALGYAVEEHVVRQRRRLLNHACSAFDYGFAATVIEWGVVEGIAVPTRFRPKLPELCEALEYVDDGTWAGARIGGQDMPPSKVLWYAYDSEAEGRYGRSRNENVRTVYQAWTDSLHRLGQYTGKIAGVIPMIQYPEGESFDKSGAKVDNFELAKKVLQDLGKGHGVAMPNVLARWAEDALARGVDPAGLRSWMIDFLEPSSGAGAEIHGSMRYLDSLLLRGWLVAERAVAEGQSGTRADAQSHGDFVVEASVELAGEIVEAIDEQVVQPMVRMTVGDQWEGLVRLRTKPLDDEQRKWVRDIVGQVLTQPANADLMLEMVRLDQLFDQAGLPQREDAADVQDRSTDGRIDNRKEQPPELAGGRRGRITPQGAAAIDQALAEAV